jgi:hypothetical protein
MLHNEHQQGDTQMTKTQHISKMILEAFARCGDIKQALDEVCGAGTSAKLISEVYDELRRRHHAA